MTKLEMTTTAYCCRCGRPLLKDIIQSTDKDGNGAIWYCSWSCALEGVVSFQHRQDPAKNVRTRPHPKDFHHSEEARARCWACNGSGLLDISDADWALAQELINTGYYQTSNRYRSVARCPQVPAFDELCPPHPDCPEWLRTALRVQYNHYTTGENGAREHGSDERQLTIGQYRAFRKLRDPAWKPPPAPNPLANPPTNTDPHPPEQDIYNEQSEPVAILSKVDTVPPPGLFTVQTDYAQLEARTAAELKKGTDDE